MQLNPNSPLLHPVADQVEALIFNGKAQEAKTILDAALAQDPDHSDLIATLGLLYVFTGEEDLALDLLTVAGNGPRARKLNGLLAEHFHCRHQMATKYGRKDSVAELFLAKSTPIGDVGIKISACLIVKNESANLVRCLDSLRGVVDEIVVVDTGSTDDTVAIAESYGAKIGYFEWCDDFSAARNHALSLATGHWALWIDADEVLTPESIAALHRAVVRPQFGGYAIEIVNFTEDDSDTAQYVHNPVRLFRLADNVRFTGRIHEQISPSLSENGWPWAYLKGAKLLHHGYRPAEMTARNKVTRTVGLIEKELADHPADPFQWFNLANAYTAANDFAKAEKAAAECAKYLQSGNEIGPLNYQLWSNALLKQERAADAAKVCNEADRQGFGGMLNEFERANAYLRLGLLEEGLDAANRCLAFDWPAEKTGDSSIADYKRYIVRGQLLSLMGQYPEAIAMFDRALRVDRNYGPAIYSKAATYEKAGNLENALEEFCAGQEHSAVGQLCCKGAGRVCMSLGLPKRSMEFYRESWRRDTSDQEAWIGWVQGADALGDAPALVEAYSAYAEKHEVNADLLVNWGRALDLAGETERAMICFREAIEREPGNSNTYFNAGDLMYKLESFADAAEYYQAGLNIDPKNASGWFVLGNAMARLGVVPGAQLSYRQALAIRPDYPEASHNLEMVCQAA